jgi:hypothetical protein
MGCCIRANSRPCPRPGGPVSGCIANGRSDATPLDHDRPCARCSRDASVTTLTLASSRLLAPHGTSWQVLAAESDPAVRYRPGRDWRSRSVPRGPGRDPSGWPPSGFTELGQTMGCFPLNPTGPGPPRADLHRCHGSSKRYRRRRNSRTRTGAASPDEPCRPPLRPAPLLGHGHLVRRGR